MLIPPGLPDFVAALPLQDSFFREPMGSLRPLEKVLWECREEVERLTHRVADLQEELGVSIKENANLGSLSLSPPGNWDIGKVTADLVTCI